jgi:hypothetical protein
VSYVKRAVGSLLLVALCACGHSEPAPTVVQTAPAVVQGTSPSTVVVSQPAVVHSGVGDFATGMLMGHMLSGGGGYGGSHTVVNHTTVVNRSVIRPSYSASPYRAATPTRSYSYRRR